VVHNDNIRRLVSIWSRAYTPWTQRPSIYAWHCFRGPDSGGTKPPSRCIRCWDLRGNIPAFVQVTDDKVHDVNNFLNFNRRAVGP
jgi:hypothetical protein